MTPKKLGKLSGVSIVRIEPVGLRLHCEFGSAKKTPSIEFEISGDLALGLAKEMALLLPPDVPRRKRKRASSS
jgi:hypothetical protein